MNGTEVSFTDSQTGCVLGYAVGLIERVCLGKALVLFGPIIFVG